MWKVAATSGKLLSLRDLSVTGPSIYLLLHNLPLSPSEAGAAAVVGVSLLSKQGRCVCVCCTIHTLYPFCSNESAIQEVKAMK